MYCWIVKEEERMFGYELMALAAKEPGKYEGKRYKVTACRADHWGKPYGIVEVCRDFNAVNSMTLVGVDGDKRTAELVSITTRTELEEIPQPVPFLDAVKAYAEGKTVECTVGNSKYVYSPNGFNHDESLGYFFKPDKYPDMPISTKEILEGIWKIKEA
jgi:hypothetical protein